MKHSNGTLWIVLKLVVLFFIALIEPLAIRINAKNQPEKAFEFSTEPVTTVAQTKF
ncbi:MAG TPA: hypothetical protein VHO47_04460 [Candidatus Babeliales bacterium]|nr:hypothetical protein [Candidatus Babeliales bacterium]